MQIDRQIDLLQIGRKEVNKIDRKIDRQIDRQIYIYVDRQNIYIRFLVCNSLIFAFLIRLGAEIYILQKNGCIAGSIKENRLADFKKIWYFNNI